MKTTENRAVLFDMDGVLIDSYDAHLESWRALAEEHGRRFTREEFDRVFGRTSFEIITELWKNADLNREEMIRMDNRKELLFREILKKHFPAMPGVKELIAALDEAKFQLAVGSSGPPENIRFVLDELGVRDYFDAIVTGKDVARGKPDPEVFLVAAKKVDTAPGRCVVVEDAPSGIAAAHAGGMRCVGMTSTGRTAEMLCDADLVIGSLRSLSPETFQQLIETHETHSSSSSSE